ncbi:hypothetical protein F7725_026897 [Dissostichus mawsoni]|uniref:Integrase core domain-containing protein n=1 Tax=Dissostichus mawsoni TaxID=36200 RepID=A0A7J5X8C4_DISMA|nr:hypothetical protein F7725_026897 [Dissostichus mawsoni]
MERSLEWSRGRLINVPTADLLLQDLREYILEVRRSWPTTPAQQGRSMSFWLPRPTHFVGWSRSPTIQHFQRATLFFEELWFYSNKDGTDIKSISAHSETAIEVCSNVFNIGNAILSQFIVNIPRRGCSHAVPHAALWDILHHLRCYTDDLIKEIVAGNNQIGPESVRAQLQAQQMWIQRRRVRDSMRRIDPEAAALRAMSQRLHRRAYRVAGPNSLWHLDGNHKSIRWRIVIHGGRWVAAWSSSSGPQTTTGALP